MDELKLGDCRFDEILFESNHKLLILYGESEDNLNFIQNGTRLTAPRAKYILYAPNGEILAEKIEPNYDKVDDELYERWPTKE